jgi:hypothetical protein
VCNDEPGLYDLALARISQITSVIAVVERGGFFRLHHFEPASSLGSGNPGPRLRLVAFAEHSYSDGCGALAVRPNSKQYRNMKEAVYGAILVGCWAIGLYFFRYWRQTGEVLFKYFGASFWLLALERLLLLGVIPSHEFAPYVYFVRLVAFLVILYAIYNKNRQPPSPLSGGR